MPRLYAGTSGFAYASWKPDFYPQKLAAKDFLKHYATRLNAVEINYTFRQLPKAATLETWAAAAPDGFLFASSVTGLQGMDARWRDYGAGFRGHIAYTAWQAEFNSQQAASKAQGPVARAAWL